MNSAKEPESARVLHGDAGVWPLPSLFRNLLRHYHAQLALTMLLLLVQTAALLAMPWLATRISAVGTTWAWDTAKPWHWLQQTWFPA